MSHLNFTTLLFYKPAPRGGKQRWVAEPFVLMDLEWETAQLRIKSDNAHTSNTKVCTKQTRRKSKVSRPHYNKVWVRQPLRFRSAVRLDRWGPSLTFPPRERNKGGPGSIASIPPLHYPFSRRAGGARKNVEMKDCTKTNTSGRVEYTKAHGLNLFKELGKLAPYVSKKGSLAKLESIK